MVSVPANHTCKQTLDNCSNNSVQTIISVRWHKEAYHLRFMYAAARFPYSMALQLAWWMPKLYSWIACVHCCRANASLACCFIFSKWTGSSVELKQREQRKRNSSVCMLRPLKQPIGIKETIIDRVNRQTSNASCFQQFEYGWLARRFRLRRHWSSFRSLHLLGSKRFRNHKYISRYSTWCIFMKHHSICTLYTLHSHCIIFVCVCVYIYIYTYVSFYIHTLPFKSLGSLRNVLIFQRKALFFSMKITLN